ncbi:MAG: hypothetical protein ACYSSO_13985 [Planctomycetota bacterium]|jgi:hypothetical protein
MEAEKNTSVQLIEIHPWPQEIEEPQNTMCAGVCLKKDEPDELRVNTKKKAAEEVNVLVDRISESIEKVKGAEEIGTEDNIALEAFEKVMLVYKDKVKTILSGDLDDAPEEARIYFNDNVAKFIDTLAGLITKVKKLRIECH